MKLTFGSRIYFLRHFITMGGDVCRRPVVWIVALAFFSALAFGAAPYFLSLWVGLLAKASPNPDWIPFFGFYLLAYTLAFASRDVQWLLYTRIESAVFSAVTRKLTARSICANEASNGVGLLTQTLSGAQSLLFCGFFILMPALLETVSMLIAVSGTAQLWMAIPLVLHTLGFLFLIDFGTRRVALHERRLSPRSARVLDLVSALLGERSLLQRHLRFGLTDQILEKPIQSRDAERLQMGWTRTWTTTLLNLWTLIGLASNLVLALWFHYEGKMTLGQVVAVESVFFLVLRRLEMLSRGYRETGLAIEQCRAGVAIMNKQQDGKIAPLVSDEFQNGVWNVVSGRTGAGKSTWLLKRWEANACRASLLPQRAEILPGTIRFNLTLGERQAEDGMSTILRELDLECVLRRLPDGLDTELFPGQPSPLSGGELQRLCLARVLMHWKGEALLLDEPTSAQSGEEEVRVFQALSKFTRGKTVWVVSHRPEALRWADRVWECTGWDRLEERKK